LQNHIEEHAGRAVGDSKSPDCPANLSARSRFSALISAQPDVRIYLLAVFILWNNQGSAAFAATVLVDDANIETSLHESQI
jgi:hypothetical protein